MTPLNNFFGSTPSSMGTRFWWDQRQGEEDALQQNTPITTRVITTKMIIVVIHILLHQFIRFRCKSYLKTGNLLLQK